MSNTRQPEIIRAGGPWAKPDAQDIMANWPLSVFIALMEQAILIKENGHSLDSSIDNIIKRQRFFRGVENHVIDPHLNQADQKGSEKVISLFRRSDGKDPPRLLIEKLIRAAKETNFGIQPWQKEDAAEELEKIFSKKTASEILDQLLKITPRPFPTQPIEHHMPQELTNIGSLMIENANLGDLHQYSKNVERAYANNYNRWQ